MTKKFSILAMLCCVFCIFQNNTISANVSSSDSTSCNKVITLGEYLDISVSKIKKIIFYSFQGHFQTPYFGNNVYDNFNNLFRGEQISLASFPYEIYETKDDIEQFYNIISEFPLERTDGRRKPELNGKISIFWKREIIELIKTGSDVGGLIMIYTDKSQPILLWDVYAYLNINGMMFQTNLLNDSIPTVPYRTISHRIRDSKPSPSIFY